MHDAQIHSEELRVYEHYYHWLNWKEGSKLLLNIHYAEFSIEKLISSMSLTKK